MSKKYPNRAGFKDPVISKPIADEITDSGRDASRKAIVLDLYRSGFKGSADQAAIKLGIHFISIRPTVTQLVKLGMLERTGQTITGQFGRPQAIIQARST